MTKKSSYSISVVIFQEGDWWVAQGLEFDIATQAKTPSDLDYELQRILIGHMVSAKEEGVEPFATLPPAPQEYWEMWLTAPWCIEARILPFRVPADLPVAVPELRMGFPVARFRSTQVESPGALVHA